MSMIRRLLALDGVNVVCHFRDDGYLIEGYGLMSHNDMGRLAQFAHDYRRMTQGNADQLAMFTNMRGRTPPTRLGRSGSHAVGVRRRQSGLHRG